MLVPQPNQRVIAIAAPCGTGKTKAFVCFIESLSSHNELMIVYVSHRKALTEKALATLQPINGHSWKSYKDTEKEIDLKDNPLIIVQYEALGRIKGYAESNSHKLIFVLDEFNSICHHWYPCDSASGNASRPIGVDLPVNHALPSDDSRVEIKIF